MTKRLLVVLLLVCLSGVALGQERDLSVFTYQFKYKPAERAAAAIKALVSAEGTVAIQPSTNSMVITDRAENLKNITAALQKFDTPPQPVAMNVRLVTATRGQGERQVPDALKDVAAQLGLMSYTTFETVGSIDVSGQEGTPGIVELGAGYRADFRFGEYDSASNSIPLIDFKLAKLQGDQLAQLYKTTLNLKIGQTLIFGATRDPQSRRALLVIVSAKR
jgi:hypothetical protein